MGKTPRVELKLVRKGGSILHVSSVTGGCEYYDALKKYMGSFDREMMIAICLDVQLRPISFNVVEVGDPGSVGVDFRDHLIVSSETYMPIRRVFGKIWTKHKIG